MFNCAEAVADPLLAIYNSAISANVFPDIWKVSRIVPIHKTGLKTNITNYRPISLISIFAKVFEKLIYVSIYYQIEHELSSQQHGFIKRRSTTTNLLLQTEVIATNIDEKGQLDVIYTDFCKAFDRVDINIILRKLFKIGFHNKLITFFKSYLANRKQYVFYNGIHSKEYSNSSGVPQGSILGPLIFSIFINDLPNVLKTNVLIFADDVKISLSTKNGDDCVELQNQLNLLSMWCEENRLELNIQKCKVVTYTHKRLPIEHRYALNDTVIARVSAITDLGVTFDSQLSFRSHISEIVTKASQRAGFIIRNCREFTNVQVFKMLYIHYIRPLLEYAAIIWSPGHSVHKMRIENVQRKFLKFMYFKADGIYPPIGYPNSLLLDKFDIDSLESRRNYLDATFITNLVKNRIDCSEALEMLNFRIPRQESRQCDTFYLSTTHKCVKYNAPIVRMCRSVNNVSTDLDIFNCKKSEVRQIFLSRY